MLKRYRMTIENWEHARLGRSSQRLAGWPGAHDDSDPVLFVRTRSKVAGEAPTTAPEAGALPSRTHRNELHMRLTKRFRVAVALALLLLSWISRAQPTGSADAPPVTAPPDSFFDLVRDKDRDAARNFYKEYIDVKGMPVAASGEVADLALQRTYEIVTHMLAGRPDILQAMVSNRTYLIVIGKNQVYTDMPEYRNHPNPEFQNERVRGTGGNPTSFGEENLLSLPIDRYDDESIGVHEFGHTIDSALRRIDPTWEERRGAAFRNVREKGLYKAAYAGGN